MSTTEPCPLRAVCAPRKRASLEMLSRREWVKTFALGCIASVGSGARSTVLADISPGVNVANVIDLKTADFPVLQSTYGSVRVGLFNENLPGGKMVVTRGPGDVFYAVSAVCTHSATIVDAYLHGDTQLIICYGHDSHYAMDGTLLKANDEGTANQGNLPKYNTSYANGVVRIELPSLNFKLNTVFIQSEVGNSKRLALNYNQRLGARYKVRYTPDLITPPVAVNFALTAGGVANQTQTAVATSNNARTLYVDSTQSRGFYFIEMVVETEVAYSP
ncbi:Rieske 2Fe-2S domain-containing protein [Brevifollis gellanilyticus]|nr:Rieske 2Fe-2S domain-containing protein [Brevifollis gellanilyticus]